MACKACRRHQPPLQPGVAQMARSLSLSFFFLQLRLTEEAGKSPHLSGPDGLRPSPAEPAQMSICQQVLSSVHQLPSWPLRVGGYPGAGKLLRLLWGLQASRGGHDALMQTGCHIFRCKPCIQGYGSFPQAPRPSVEPGVVGGSLEKHRGEQQISTGSLGTYTSS